MKKYLTDWRVWLMFIQVCAVLVLIMAEPDENGAFCTFFLALCASKFIGVLLAVGVFFELKLWRNRYAWINNLLKDE